MNPLRQNKPILILRADGNNKIGYGHIFRVLAFGEWYADAYKCILVARDPDELILKTAESGGIEVIQLAAMEYSLPDENKAGQETPFDMEYVLQGEEVVVTDGYLFGTEYQKQIKAKGCKLICIDDEAKWHFLADAVINPAPSINKDIYSREPYTTIFSGKDYFLIRKCFVENKPLDKKASKAVYVSVGGSDYFGFTSKLLAAVLKQETFCVHVLYSTSFPPDTIRALMKMQEENPERVFLYCNLSGKEIVRILDLCTHAIVSASTVSLEVIARGIKPLIGHYVQNQMRIYEGLLQMGLAKGLGHFESMNTDDIAAYLVTDERNMTDVGKGIIKIIKDTDG